MPSSDSETPTAAKFTSPMPKWADDIGPRFVPFWQTALAALAAIASVAFALLLYIKL